jgi:hypothetical protein
MNIDQWNYFYKIDPVENRLSRHNMLYTPLVNPENNIMCMLWDSCSDYQTKYGERPEYTADLVDFFFRREIEHIEIFKNYSWAPEIIDIDKKNKRIFYKWYGETCNNIVYDKSRNLDKECVDWKYQLETILTDIYQEGYMKMSLYPHCHYLDANKKLHTIDFYGCASRSNPYIEVSKLYGMIGPRSNERFDEATTNGLVDLEFFFKRAMTHFIKWPHDPLPDIYYQITS